MFQRPKDGLPARHLFVANCSPTLGVSADALLALCSEFGRVSVTQASEEAFYSFVSFDSVQAATAALEAVHGKRFQGRKLVVKYAALRGGQAGEEEEQVPVRRTAEACGIEGLSLHLDFVTASEEKELLSAVNGSGWQTLARRRVQHYGYEFSYAARNVDPSAPVAPLPAALDPILLRLQALPDAPAAVDQLTVNEYPPGVGLSPHIDTHSAFTGVIASLSLGCGAVMEFRREGRRRPLYLPPRSLLIMAAEARYAWAHYIPHRKSDSVDGEVVPRTGNRVSFTFRQVRGYPCECHFPEYCNSQLGSIPPTRMALASAPAEQPDNVGRGHEQQNGCHQPPTYSQGNGTSSFASGQRVLKASGTMAASCPSILAADIGHGQQASDAWVIHEDICGPEAEEAELALMELEHVHKVYNAIAPHFSATRFAIWPKVRAFIEGVPHGGIVADVGCGNGKYFGVRRDIAVLGSDRSPGLAALAARRLLPPTPQGERPVADVAVADGFALPYREGCFDAVLCIAVLHHVASPARRLRLLRRLLALLRPGGQALVTVWAHEQENPAKLAKWQPIASPAASQQHQEHLGSAAVLAAQMARGDTSQAGCMSCSEETQETQLGTDFMVPWHLPLHRVEAPAAAAAAQVNGSADQGAGSLVEAQDGQLAGGLPGPSASQQEHQQSGHERALGQVNKGKGTVEFSRYYHLFRQGELEALVHQLPGARLVESFFDRDNWCAIMERLDQDVSLSEHKQQQWSTAMRWDNQ